MNIFYLDHNPKVCAEQHVDKHCVKMILEYAQLLSTAHRVLDGNQHTRLSKTGRKQTAYVLSDSRESTLYSSTHVNHPSTIWVRQSDKNYDWLYTLWCELMSEFKYRYNKSHVTEKLIRPLKKLPDNITTGVFTEPTPAMPDQYKVKGDSIKSYQNFYNGDKRHMFTWKNRTVPQWVQL